MPTKRRPLRGSRGFYPKKRAKRIYPKIKKTGVMLGTEVKPLAFAGYKAGMTHAILIGTNPNAKLSGQELFTPLTVLECPPLNVFGYRYYVSDPENNNKVSYTDILSEKLDKKIERSIPLPKKITDKSQKLNGLKNLIEVRILVHTNPTFKKKPEIFEIPLSSTPDKQLEWARSMLGKQINITDIFKQGDFVDVSAVTKGKGTQGPVKRFGIVVLGRKFQQMHRHTGALGQTEPGKIRSTVPAAGQLGFQTRTEFNKQIISIQDSFDIKGGFVKYGNVKSTAVFLAGSVPGPSKRLIMIKRPVRPPKTIYPVQVKYISTASNLGD